MNRIDITQDWSHGYTPKCCACKFFGNLADEGEIPYEKSGSCYKVKKDFSDRIVKAGKRPVWHMTHACMNYEFRGEDMLTLEGKNE